MKVYYTGINRYNNEYLASYWIGSMDNKQYTEIYNIHYQDYCHNDTGKLYFMMVRSYLYRYNKIMYEWIKKCNVQFGGHFIPGFDDIDIYLLLKPESSDNLAFRLCFDIKAAIE